MRALLTALRTICLGIAWLLFLCAVGLFLVEESGFLTRLVRNRVARELGSLGARLDVEKASLRWFEPGIELEGVTFDGERSEEGDWIAGKERVRITSVRIRFRPDLDPLQPVESITVRGGRVLLSGALVEAFEALLGEIGGEGGEPSRGVGPLVSVGGLQVDLEAPDGEEVPIGSADLILEADGAGSLRLRGRLLPTLAGAVASPAAVHIHGETWRGRGMHVHASARAVELDSSELRPGGFLDGLGLEEFRGELTIDADARFHPAPDTPPRISLRLALRDAWIRPKQIVPMEDVDLDIDARFAPEPRSGLWDPNTWAVTARAEGLWNRSRTEVWSLLGQATEDETWVEAWARIDRLNLDEETLEALHAAGDPEIREQFEAYSPSGLADVAVAFRLPQRERVEDGREIPTGDREVVVDVTCGGEAGIVYHGKRDETGRRQGIPIPCEDVRGLIVYARNDALARPVQLAFVGMEAYQGSGTALAEGLICSPLVGREADLDLSIRVPAMAVDERLRVGLAGLEATSRVWDDYDPAGGRISAECRMRKRAELGGLTAWVKVGLENVDLTWRGVPVPMEKTSGELELRWADRAARLTGGTRPAVHRPIGIAWRMASEPDQGARALVSGLWRQESVSAAELDPSEVPKLGLQELTVEIGGLLLRGQSWETLAATFPGLGEAVQAYRAQGIANATFHGSRPHLEAPYRYDVEGRPVEVLVTPVFFQRQVRDVEGRILIRGVQASSDEEPEVEARLSFTGTWPGGVELASHGVIPPSGRGAVQILGAGIDPNSSALKGALFTALAATEGAGSGELDVSAFNVDGRLDLAADVEFDAELPDSARATYRVYLRDNRFESDAIALESMHGVLVQEDDVLRSPLILATMASTPVVLRNVLYLSIDRAQGVDEADPLLRQPGFMTEGGGHALQADWSADSIPMDREHLSPFLEEATVDLLVEQAGLTGWLDFEDARFIVVSEPDGKGKIALKGRMLVRDTEFTAGLPITIPRASIQVESMIQETGRVRGWWEVEDLEALVAGRELSHASMIMTFVDGRLTIDNLRGRFEGGAIASLGGLEKADTAIAVDLSEPYGFALAMRAKDVRIDDVLGNVFESSIEDLGMLEAAIRLNGRGADVLALSGTAGIRLSDARLWSIPAIRETFSSLGSDKTAIFDRMQARLVLEDGVIHLSDIRVRSPLLKLVGDGTIDLDGSLRCDLEVRYALLDKLGLINRLFYWLSNSLWRVAIRGDMARPKIFVRNAFRELILGFDDEVPRQLPLPDWSSLSRRF